MLFVMSSVLDLQKLVHELLLDWPEGRSLHSDVFFALHDDTRGNQQLIGERATWSGRTAEGVARELRRLSSAVPAGARGVILATAWVDPSRLEAFLRLCDLRPSRHAIRGGKRVDRTRQVLRRSLAAQRSGFTMSGTEREAKRRAHRRLEPIQPPLIEARSPLGLRPSIPGIPVEAIAQASVAIYAATPGLFTPGHVASLSNMDGRIFIKPVWRPEGGAMLPERYLVGRNAELLLNGSRPSDD
jgi:hypothetical protein